MSFATAVSAVAFHSSLSIPIMKRLLFWLHRWLGVALALFMCLWFFSGLVIIYAGSATTTRHQQLAHGESLTLDAGWLSVGEAWERSAAARQAAYPKTGKESGTEAGASVVAEAHLLRLSGEPTWIVDDDKGRRFALSAKSGELRSISTDQALTIAAHWLSAEGRDTAPRYLELVDKTSLLRNYEALAPFHRVAVDDFAGTELLISSRSGEVLSAATSLERGMYWAGNWLHLFRPLESLGWGESRRDVLMWSVSIALAATLTGLIVGWLRWRPGWGGRPTYSQGRVHPYRDFWFKWHFWAGLIGGSFALLWAFSGVVNSNPWQVFSPANPTKVELSRYVGKQVPAAMANWRPDADASTAITATAERGGDVVELAWHRLGGEALQVAYTRDGQRVSLAKSDTPLTFSEAAVTAAAQRLSRNAPIIAQTLQSDYDSYYYASHRRSPAERPLPVLRVELGDQAHTHLYIDPQDGHLLLRQDASRRAYRWLFNAVHYWDLSWLYPRPLWDAWTLTWVALGWLLSLTSLVIGWKRLRVTLRRKKHRGVSVQPESDQAIPDPAIATES